MNKINVRTRSIWFLPLTLFLIYCGIFVVVMTVFSTPGDQRPIIHILFKAGLMGAFLALLMSITQISAGRRMGYRKPLHAVQVGTVTIPESGPKALEVIRSVLAQIPARERVSWGDTHPVLLARVPVSWSSWGEKMRFVCHPNPDGSTEIHVSSRPLVPALLTIDQGKGLKNVRCFMEAVPGGGQSQSIEHEGVVSEEKE